MAKQKNAANKNENARENFERNLSGSMVQAIVKDLKANGHRIWSQLNQQEQNSIIGLIEDACEDVIKQTTVFFAGQKWEGVPVVIKQVVFNEKPDVKLRILKVNETVHKMSEKIGGNAVLILADHADYFGGEMPEAEPDQKALNLTPGVDFDPNAGQDAGDDGEAEGDDPDFDKD